MVIRYIALGGVNLNSDTTSTTADGSGVVLSNDGYTGLEVDKGTNPGTVNVWIPAGATLQAAAGGQIIATNSTGTEFLQTTYLTNATATGTALYISADKVCSATDASVTSKQLLHRLLIRQQLSYNRWSRNTNHHRAEQVYTVK